MITLISPKKAHRYFEEKMEFTTGPVELKSMIDSGENINIVDVRATDDYMKGHIPNAMNLPKGAWSSCTGLRRDMVNIVYCYSEVCHLAAAAAREFADHGYPVMELEGGFESWKQHHLPMETGQ